MMTIGISIPFIVLIFYSLLNTSFNKRYKILIYIYDCILEYTIMFPCYNSKYSDSHYEDYNL